MITDVQGDQAEVMLSIDFYCHSCTVLMVMVGPKRYKCPVCSSTYEDKD